MIGAVIPAYSTSAESSAQELAALENAIREFGVKAIFIGTTANPVLAERVATDLGIQFVPLYVESLGGPGSGVESYVDYIRYNTEAIANALK
jgi:ABC-type Zn uptake system ZnuABC Zn-binding protein ZnuA